MLSARNGAREIVGLLDIGSSKICCAIAERTHGLGEAGVSGLRLLAITQQRSDGVRNGMVVDLDRAEVNTRQAVALTEQRAGVTLSQIIVAVSSGRLSSQHFSAQVDLEDGEVRPSDLDRIARRAQEYAVRDGGKLLHMNRIHYSLDGEIGVRRPLGMAGHRLTCQYHAVTGDPASLRNIEGLIERCYLSVAGFVPSGLASALAATTADEQQFGVACLDIGAGATKVAVIADGRFLHVDTIAVGGAYLTHDVAVMLSTPLAEAERIKTLCGTIMCARSDENVSIPYWRSDESGFVAYQSQQGEQQETTRAELTRILAPRARHQLELVREHLERSNVAREMAQSIVLTAVRVNWSDFRIWPQRFSVNRSA